MNPLASVALPIPPGLIAVLDFVQWSAIAWFFALHLASLAPAYVATVRAVLRQHRHGVRLPWGNVGPCQPPVSILVPAFNDEPGIVATVRALLRLGYRDYEIIVVNDGSSDDTLQALVRAFGLVPFPEAYRRRLRTGQLHCLFASPAYPRVRVVDKAHGGRADALNAGINCARFPLFCVVDTQRVLQRDSLDRMVQPFLEDATTVAAFGALRVVNGCQARDGFVTRADLPRRLLPMLQAVESLRGFVQARLAGPALNALPAMPGAFGLFHKERIIAAGGYRDDTAAVDMELCLRLHGQLRAQRRPYRIAFVPDPVCWVRAPETLRRLRRQRSQAQRGLVESLLTHARMLFRREDGAVGSWSLPILLLVECAGPVIEVLGYAAVLLLALAGQLSPQSAAVFLFASVGLGIVHSLHAVATEELSFQLHPGPGQRVALVAAAIVENLGYRQLTSAWRVMGLSQALAALRARARVQPVAVSRPRPRQNPRRPAPAPAIPRPKVTRGVEHA
ncbi:glycosyltransferase family 2 protein [Agrilutibacter solisilvae]|uniref:Glycosyltransferase family 2 protein n=1 Tax=Agrilutibacter solisilvae TaxID=2763317 RepID=A0A975AT90_9GAMM|nr:glycosyltransferase family 2 protein [Lysobacter solisilvae]QSX79043.1 glycosyltransferase family 2 protein [Lysobacter solisilvae]